MIKYKVIAGEAIIELECQTIGELIEYLDYDKEVTAEAGFMVNIPDDIPMYDSKACVWKQAVEEATSYDWSAWVDTPSVEDDVPMYDPKKNSWSPARFSIKADQVGIKTNTKPTFVRPDGSSHQPKTETINDEEWFVNDGKQPVGDDVRVDAILGGARVWNYKACVIDWGKEDSIFSRTTHWRLAK